MEIDLRRQSVAIQVLELHDVGDARRQAMYAAKSIGFDETLSGKVGIVTTELAGNLAKHAGGGQIVLRASTAGADSGLEVMSLDDGPGMDVQKCLADGYSTAGTPGTGLGAVKRISTTFDYYSAPGKGTVLVSELWARPPSVSRYEIGAICLPIKGERLCGDGWAVRQSEDGVDMVVSDGLGHGLMAAEASDAALGIFTQKPGFEPGAMLEAMHGALKGTRGAAVLTARLRESSQRLDCAGVGNIAGYVLANPKPRGLVSVNGIVGHTVHKVKEFSYDCGADDTIVLHSDGLTTHWKLEDFPGLAGRSAGVIAGAMYKYFKRGRDDATVLVVRRR